MVGVDRAHARLSFPAADDEAPLDLFRLDAGQLDDLVPRTVSRNERHRLARKRKSVCEQPHDRVVRAAALRRRRDAHLPRVAVPADDAARVAPGATRSRTRVETACMQAV